MKMNEPEVANAAELAWAFPSVDAGAKPLGGRVLVQLRRTKKKATSAGIILVEETKETEKWNNMVAKVIEIGPLASRTATRCRAGLKARGAPLATTSASRSGAVIGGKSRFPARMIWTTRRCS